MPKSSKSSALKKARKLLKSAQLKYTVSSSESDVSSESSAEFSHVPVDNVPNLQKLSVGDSEDINMEPLVEQVSALTFMLDEMRKQQERQQQILNNLSQSLTQTNSSNQQQPRTNEGLNVDTLFKIPDPIKSIPKFEGNRKQLTAWLNTAENTLNVFKDLVSEQQYNIFVTAIINKIEGKARDIICLAGNPQSFTEIKQILTNALGDRQELTFYKSQLWQTKMAENMTVHKYFNKCKEITQNIKSLAKQKQLYRDHWEAINSFIEEDALAAFLAGLTEPYFGYAQASKPDDMEGAYAFVCKFKCKPTTNTNLETSTRKTNYPQKDFRSQNFTKPIYDKNKTEKQDKNNDTTQPMDIGSTRSKLTLNKRQINNNEIDESDETDQSEESENENIDLNFCWIQDQKEQT